MRKVHFVDTSILLNLLNVPNRNADADIVKEELKILVHQRDTVILPIATIIETGNHIAHVADGNIRRRLGGEFGEILRATADGKAPWKFTSLSWSEDTLRCLADQFSTYVVQEIGIGDYSIIAEYQQYLDTTPGVSARIWSMDQHLQSYDFNYPEIGM